MTRSRRFVTTSADRTITPNASLAHDVHDGNGANRANYHRGGSERAVELRETFFTEDRMPEIQECERHGQEGPSCDNDLHCSYSVSNDVTTM